MDVRNCRKCRRIFNYVVGPVICPACRQKMEEKFADVKKFVQDNPGVGIPQIAEACEVETQQIHQWIREERLVFAEDSPIGIQCESCGAMIRTGRFCDKCKAELANGLNPVKKQEKVSPAKAQRDRERMRFLDR